MAIVSRRTIGEERVKIDGIDRGMVFWATVLIAHAVGSEQSHDQPSPWVVVSLRALSDRLPIVQAVPLSTKSDKAGTFQTRIELPPEDWTNVAGAKFPLRAAPLVALVEQVRVLDHGRLEGEPVARLKARALYKIEAAMRYLFQIPLLPGASPAPTGEK